MAPAPPELGHDNGRLMELPASPNCVSTQADDESKRMAPLEPLADGPAASISKLKAICEQLGAKIITHDDDYLRTEFRTRIMRYVDDVEFVIHDNAIHFRSASRLGYSDLGVNRRRMNRIRAIYTAN